MECLAFNIYYSLLTGWVNDACGIGENCFEDILYSRLLLSLEQFKSRWTPFCKSWHHRLLHSARTNSDRLDCLWAGSLGFAKTGILITWFLHIRSSAFDIFGTFIIVFRKLWLWPIISTEGTLCIFARHFNQQQRGTQPSCIQMRCAVLILLFFRWARPPCIDYWQ